MKGVEKEILLKAESISKSFGGVKALQNVSFELQKGEVLSVIGENGAGKSTLMKIVAGALKNDEGKIYFQGEELSLHSPLDAVRQGFPLCIRSRIFLLICRFWKTFLWEMKR